MHYSTISGVSDNEKVGAFSAFAEFFMLQYPRYQKIGLFIERKENGMAETRKLYYEKRRLFTVLCYCAGLRAHGRQFCRNAGRHGILPEGGGQPADRGALGGARVLDVHERTV